MSDVEFISYTGKWPNLCSGELTLKINGQIRKDIEISSGGCCGFNSDYSESYIEHGPWHVFVPEDLKNYEHEIEKIVNENIPEGCCGGCL